MGELMPARARRKKGGHAMMQLEITHARHAPDGPSDGGVARGEERAEEEAGAVEEHHHAAAPHEQQLQHA